MKQTIRPIDSYTAQNGVSLHITRRVDVGPALMVDGIELAPLNVAALREYFAQNADPRSRDLCRCHVFRYVHDMGKCDHPFRRARGLRLWLLDHRPVRHFTGWVWMNLTTERARFRAALRLQKRRPDLCWCEMVDAYLLQGKSYGDYACGCEVPMLADVHPIVPGRCYCRPDEMTYDSSEPQAEATQDRPTVEPEL